MKRTYFYVFSAIIMWSTLATATKLLVNGLDTLTVLFYTCLFATAPLLLAAVRKKSFSQKLSWRTAVRMVLNGSLGVLFYNYFFYSGTAYISAQKALLLNELWPILVIVFSGIFLREKITISQMAAILFSFLGIMIAISNGDPELLRELNPRGVLFCLGAAVSYALFTVFEKKSTYDKTVSTLLAFTSCAVITFLLLLVRGGFTPLTGVQMAGLVYNGIVCNALPYLCWALAMAGGNTAVMANMIYLVPLGSLIITHFVFGEPITFFSVAGLALILFGILLQMWIEHKERQ